MKKLEHARSTANQIQFVSKLFEVLLKDKTQALDMASDVITGKKKLSEVRILANGGPGISKRKKRIAKKALKYIERRMEE